jgi:hypothetical protein
MDKISYHVNCQACNKPYWTTEGDNALNPICYECREKQNDKLWSDNDVINFVNWYIKLHGLPFNYILENRSLLEHFRNEYIRI